MTRIEQRLADALAARAKAIDPKSVRPLPWAAPVRHRRERRRRWLAPAAAAISIVAVAAVVASLPRHAPRAGQGHPVTAQRATFPGELLGIDALSATNAWAVGLRYLNPSDTASSKIEPLIMHWDGTSWRRVPAPSEPVGGVLRGISGSPDDVWAVGTWGGTLRNPGNKPMIIHWNGKRWQIARLATGIKIGNLYAVSARSASDAWAVGDTGPKGGALLMHWNGRDWQQVPSPRPVPGQNLDSVVAISASDAWAVGADTRVGELTTQWNGTRWRIIHNPDSVHKYGNLVDLTALSANEIWAIRYAPGTPNIKLLRWDGTHWHLAPAPSVPSNLDPLWAIAAVSPDNIWAAGENVTSVLMRHWNGTGWSTPKSFEHHVPGVIYNLSVRSASDVWGIGSHGKNRQIRPLILHWNGKTWTKVLS